MQLLQYQKLVNTVMKSFNQRNFLYKEVDTRLYNLPGSHFELVTDALKLLPIHFKLILYSCFKLYDQNKKRPKVTLSDIFIEYQKLTTELNIGHLSMKQVTDKIQEFDMLGFLKCKYIRRGSGQIKYVDVKQPAEISKYVSVLKEEIEKIRPEELELLRDLDKQSTI